MAIDLIILEAQLFDPCWEPDDTSIIEHPSGRLQLKCNFSQRLIAFVDTPDEAHLLLSRARIGASRRYLRNNKVASTDFMHGWLTRKITAAVKSLIEKGHQDSDSAPEIQGADQRNAAAPGAVFIRAVLGSEASASIKYAVDLSCATKAVGDRAPSTADTAGVQAFLGRFVASQAPGNEAEYSASIDLALEDGDRASIEVRPSSAGFRVIEIHRARASSPEAQIA